MWVTVADWNEEVQKCPNQALAWVQMPCTHLGLEKNCLQQTEVLEHGHPTHLWHRATPIIVGWFMSQTWKNNNKWYTTQPKLLCNFYSICIICKCGPCVTTMCHNNECSQINSCFHKTLVCCSAFNVSKFDNFSWRPAEKHLEATVKDITDFQEYKLKTELEALYSSQ